MIPSLSSVHTRERAVSSDVLRLQSRLSSLDCFQLKYCQASANCLTHSFGVSRRQLCPTVIKLWCSWLRSHFFFDSNSKAGESDMDLVGFSDGLALPFLSPRVFSLCMHRSASTSITPSVLIIFLIFAGCQDFVCAGCSWRMPALPSPEFCKFPL